MSGLFSATLFEPIAQRKKNKNKLVNILTEEKTIPLLLCLSSFSIYQRFGLNLVMNNIYMIKPS